MRKTASEIANGVLGKLAYEVDAPPGIPALLAGGTGIGALAGGLGGSVQSMPDVIRAIRISGKIPEQQAQKKQLLNLLKQVRKELPQSKSITDRTLTKRLLRTSQPPEMHYALRRGYEEGLAGLSHSTKTLKVLKNKILRNAILKSTLGAGVGLGGGLLAATALGHFDQFH